MESNITDRTIQKITKAVSRVTGISPDDMISKCRKPPFVFARILLSHNLYSLGLSTRLVAIYIARDRTTCIYLLRKYNDEYQTNKQFRAMADRVKELINS